jgi:hypothetical protein
VQEESQDLADVFSADATEDSNSIPEESPSNEVNPSSETIEDQPIIPEEPVESAAQEVAIENVQEEAAPQLTEALNSVSEPEPVNNEVVL